MRRSLLAPVFMAYGNPPDLSPGGNLPVYNNEKPAESGGNSSSLVFLLNEHHNESLSVPQITIRNSFILEDALYLNMNLLL